MWKETLDLLATPRVGQGAWEGGRTHESLTSLLTGLLGRECVSRVEEPSSQTSPDLHLHLLTCKVLRGQDGEAILPWWQSPLCVPSPQNSFDLTLCLYACRITGTSSRHLVMAVNLFTILFRQVYNGQGSQLLLETVMKPWTGAILRKPPLCDNKKR